MRRKLGMIVTLVVAGFALPAQSQPDGTPARPPGLDVAPLPEGPIRYSTAEGMDIRVVVVARGLEYPWSIAFLPNGDKLVVERVGRLRLIRGDVLLPDPVTGLPEVRVQGFAGLGDVAVHPDFEQNGFVYLTYNKPLGGDRGALAVARGVWRNDVLDDLTDIFVTEEAGGISRMIFGQDSKLYVSTFVGQESNAQNPNVHGGKVLRLNDDGTVPDDNPFVGRADHKPEVFTMGHRTPSGLAVHEPTGDIYEVEMGPNGGDEVNRLVPGGNYGWPLVSLGRAYPGPWQSENFNGEGMEDPVVFWMPSISTSGLDFYSGDRLSAWRGDLFVGGMRYGEISGTGQLHRIRFNENMEEIRREPLLTDLRHRIRDVRQGPDGLLYLLTDADDGAVLRIEPAD
ncbi:MAG TPA: PQQ-dependent sugar dehydrogenase [Gammaproteobacteria bacterium]|nr:PQQ-dependent sugar dehydrogenase [Gammaproteobacteria bacterium]